MATEYTYTSPSAIDNNAVNLGRTQIGPLDNSSVFASIHDFEYYLSKGAKKENLTPTFLRYVENFEKGYEVMCPYVGLIVTIVDSAYRVVKLLKITDTEVDATNGKYGKYEEVGTTETYNLNDYTLGQYLTLLTKALGGNTTEILPDSMTAAKALLTATAAKSTTKNKKSKLK